MPTLPTNTKCSSLGCKNPRSKLNSYCVEHGGLNSINTKERKEFTSMYQTNQWRSLRQVQLSKHPLCESCMTMGKVVQANHVDHVFPWAKIGKQAFYDNIFQSLCTHCHSHKSAQEKQGIYNHYSTGKQYTPNDYRLTMKDSSWGTAPNVL
jgi:5-methylcytosine-specific restriction protein A